MRQPLVIEVGSKTEAECVGQALSIFGGELGERRGRWTVTLPQHDLAFGALFAALETCLHDNGIASARLVVGERSYVMEAASA